jgi:transcriptional regulator with XRE-family HTH domain
MNQTAANLLALLASREMSANDLAEATETAQPTISRIINGESKDPRDSTLAPLAQFFGLTLNQLKTTPTDKVVALSRGLVSPEAVTPDEAPANQGQDVLQLFAALGTLMGWIAATRPAEAPLLRAGLEEAADQMAEHGSARNRLDALIAALPGDSVNFPARQTSRTRTT